MVSTLSNTDRRSANIACASAAATSNCSLRPGVLDVVGGVGHLDVGGLDDVPDAVQPLLRKPLVDSSDAWRTA